MTASSRQFIVLQAFNVLEETVSGYVKCLLFLLLRIVFKLCDTADLLICSVDKQ